MKHDVDSVRISVGLSIKRDARLQNPVASVAHNAQAREADLPGLEALVNQCHPSQREHVRSLTRTISVDFMVCSFSRTVTLGGVVLEEDEVCPQATAVASLLLSERRSLVSRQVLKVKCENLYQSGVCQGLPASNV